MVGHCRLIKNIKLTDMPSACVFVSICVGKSICLLEHNLVILYVGDCIYDDV